MGHRTEDRIRLSGFLDFTPVSGQFLVAEAPGVGYTRRVPDGLRDPPTHYIRNGGHVTFLVGDKVIYPNHGLGVVERIEEKTILGTTCGFYHLRILANETTVLVPIDNVDGVGL